jgi:hypothetical protein
MAEHWAVTGPAAFAKLTGQYHRWPIIAYACETVAIDKFNYSPQYFSWAVIL